MTTTLAPSRTLDRLALDTPIGRLILEGTDVALTRVLLPNAAADAPPAPTAIADAGPVVSSAARQLDEYFAGRRTVFEIPFEIDGTPFQQDVWRALGEIPYAETVSYTELAEIVGRPRACRAVGQANGANPLPIVLPCHRVLAAGRRIGGYGGGLDCKHRLLAHEGVTLV
ncbi:MAG TPA: methylated-DNA--[protein]-cysteine S-methyltransferase [Solirubrobacteraceae bacterium]|nr:methylated-DNA--[protein]-cysteine S-methyltransferase [Solirubrobacteraceae bacterium]